MEIAITGRNVNVSDRLREYLDTKLSKVPQLDPRVQRIEVMVSHEPNPRRAKTSERVEITCRSKGPVIRAEAGHDDRQAAVDLAVDKLLERLRRAHDKRNVLRGRRRTSVAEATATLTEPLATDLPPEDFADEPDPFGTIGDSPIEVREKVHESAPMPLAEAVRRMELVGHDFFLFHDSDNGRPSVVYRRRGWSYGVIHLDVQDQVEAPTVNGTPVEEPVSVR
ncbi:30S ribosomal protein S30 [Janibacter sp. Soil728]|uniref:ribosome hibernation-promoting factor, HPF/YfiA family n=1 Tax=Janibacter sp. Soil728 TaxID=1736393 RepID=UPI0006F9ECCC|nr:ribosome-associated translation inhibitor RaiA [Janibacter sp. Soil728]KRE37691.1 30S ribosomal protein S30 [Janibacter sp. Soil728]